MKTELATMLALAALACTGLRADFVDCVNPKIGNISHMLVPTFPTTQRPNGMLRFTPPSYGFTQDKVGAFGLLLPTHRGQALFRMHPFGGKPADAFHPWQGTWDQEKGLPHRYSVYIDSEQATFELAPGEKAAVARVGFEAEAPAHALVFSPRDGRGVLKAEGRVVTGTDWFGGLEAHIRVEFEDAPVRTETKGKACAVFFGGAPGTVRFRYAVSYIDAAQAARSLAAEAPDFDLDRMASGARAAWNDALGRIEVQGGTADDRVVFYTALYRTYERMVNVTEQGRYRGYDKQVHDAQGVDYYCDDWTWDTYRAQHPLFALLRPAQERAKLTSYLRMAQQNPEGWVPLFPNVDRDMHGMNGFHPPALFLDAYRKGVAGVDWKAAFKALAHTERTSSRLPWNRLPRGPLDEFHDAHGYFPAIHPGPDGKWAKDPEWPAAAHHDERRQSVAVTLAYSYDCWCLAELAKEFGTPGDVAEFTKKSLNYRNLWRKDTGFFHPKDKDGKWIEPFDYTYAGGQGARDYYDENNAWTYIWDVQHAIPDLIDLFGGVDKARAKMDRMFNTGYGRARWHFYDVLPDSTGNMGMFTMGNEPSFHIPYLYNYFGEPWKTQKLVRKIMEAWFRNDLMGMCGDEDGGGMSAFAVFSSMGFYPVTPGLPRYDWGSPVFSKVAIHLENGKTFTLDAPAASKDAKYVRSIKIDGRPTASQWLDHADIVRGAHVEVEMSDRPLRGPREVR
ncbi:MAG: GH92 family glycosyl hydrolase [Kiritimatiellae bacterium]|nr:GH92 family glycosyl hydrolase [Kiritimatiellia bacterium]